MGLHFLGRGRHWQISQLWASVRKPKGQSRLQPRLRLVHSSSPANTHGQHVSSKDEQSRTHRGLAAPRRLLPLHRCELLSSTTALGMVKNYSSCYFIDTTTEPQVLVPTDEIKSNCETDFWSLLYSDTDEQAGTHYWRCRCNWVDFFMKFVLISYFKLPITTYGYNELESHT